MFGHVTLTGPTGDEQPEKSSQALEMSLFDSSWPVLGNSPLATDFNVDIMNRGYNPAILLHPFVQHYPWNNDLDLLPSDDNFGSSQTPPLSFTSFEDATSVEPMHPTLDSIGDHRSGGQAFRCRLSVQE